MKRLTFKGILKKTRNKDENFPVKYLGTVLCSHPDRDEICRAMAEMYAVSRQKMKKLPLHKLTVSSREITLQKVTDVAKVSPVKKFVIPRIVYCGVDKRHQKIFAFFYRSPESIYGALNCHVVECRSKRDARHIALKLSEIFEEMASEKSEENPETRATCESNVVQERTLSMIQLHMSVESLFEDERKGDICGSPQIQRSKPNESRKPMNCSDLQLHWIKCENNSSGYGDSSEDLSNETAKLMKQRKSVQVHLDGGESSETGQVKMDYVNAEIGSSSRENFKRNSCGSISKTFARQTVGFTKINEWDSSKKDRNANLFEYKTFEYMNIDTRSDNTAGELI